jgi:hypothetical protein
MNHDSLQKVTKFLEIEHNDQLSLKRVRKRLMLEFTDLSEELA